MKNLKYPSLFLFLFLLLSSQQSNLYAYDLILSIGNLCEYIGKIQTDDSGGTNLCQFDPYLASSFDYSIGGQYIISPEVGFSAPMHGRDTNISKMSLFALINTKYKFSTFHSIFGFGLFFSRISGSGGTQDLNNGASVTSYPMPDATVYSRNFILNLGLGMDFNKEWSADFHTYIFNSLSREDRAFSMAINGSYHFGEY